MKTLVTTLLVAALLVLPFNSTAPAQSQPPQPRFTMLELCIVVPVLALATVAVICIRYRESHTPWPTNSNQWSNSAPVQPSPPGTNEYGVFTNSFASLRSVMLVDGPPVYTVDIADQGYADTNLVARGWTNNITFTNAFQFTIKAGERPDNLQPLYVVKGWLSAGGRLIQYEDPQGHYLCSSYAFWGSYPQCPPMGSGLERARFMTFTSP